MIYKQKLETDGTKSYISVPFLYVKIKLLQAKIDKFLLDNKFIHKYDYDKLSNEAKRKFTITDNNFIYKKIDDEATDGSAPSIIISEEKCTIITADQYIKLEPAVKQQFKPYIYKINISSVTK